MEVNNSPYYNFSDKELVGYYLSILTNISSGKLSNAMFHESDYLENIAAKRGLYFTYKENIWLSSKNHPILITVSK
ncbi:MAG: hypothetical protein WAM07_13010 [Halobacillus sp.]|uniref:hypothetical protein n=1 Tax=Halobacillus sp. TaxID=56800 RepID=UPI003BB0EF4E